MDVSALLFGYSKALYSTWIFYKPDNLLIDCGEGAATTLGNGGFAIERVLLTHGHIDHISGLPSLLWSRAAGMGDTEKPLEIYYPQDDLFVGDMREYLQRTQQRLPFQLKWNPLQAGDAIVLKSGGRRVEAFATDHIPQRLTLGYKIVEPRRRLKPEHVHLSQAEIRRIATERGRAGTGALMEEYSAILAAFGGDGLALPLEAVDGCELLFHEATLLDAADRKHQRHATLDEAIEVAARVQPATLVLYHISGRYRAREVEQAARRSARRHELNSDVWCLFRDRLWRLDSKNDFKVRDESLASANSTGATL